MIDRKSRISATFENLIQLIAFAKASDRERVDGIYESNMCITHLIDSNANKNYPYPGWITDVSETVFESSKPQFIGWLEGLLDQGVYFKVSKKTKVDFLCGRCHGHTYTHSSWTAGLNRFCSHCNAITEPLEIDVVEIGLHCPHCQVSSSWNTEDVAGFDHGDFAECPNCRMFGTIDGAYIWLKLKKLS